MILLICSKISKNVGVNPLFFEISVHEFDVTPFLSLMVLLSIVKKLRQREMEMRVLILGLDNSGKTTILQRINGEDYTKVAPTFGFNIKTLEFREWKLNCWDIGGQSSLRSYWRNYFEQTDAVVWVVDSTDKKRLRDCRAELDKLLGEECLKGVTLLVLANKNDLSNALSADQIQEVSRVSVDW